MRARSYLTTTMSFFCRHVQTVILVTMQRFSVDMLTTSEICIVVAKCEWALRLKSLRFVHGETGFVLCDEWGCRAPYFSSCHLNQVI